MAEIVVLGTGLGGLRMAYELADQLCAKDPLTLIGKGPSFQFYPSNPWVAVGRRERRGDEVDLTAIIQKSGSTSSPRRPWCDRAYPSRSARLVTRCLPSPSNRNGRRATSNGRRTEDGCISPRQDSRNTSCARSRRPKASRFMNVTYSSCCGFPTFMPDRRHKEAGRSGSTMNETTLTLVCPSRQAINRVPVARLAAGPHCGECHANLFDGHPAEVDAAGFDRHVQHDQIPVLADLWAPWCGPCRAMAPRFAEAVSGLEPRFRLIRLNADTAPDTLARYGVRSIPTLLLFHRGTLLAQNTGAMPANGSSGGRRAMPARLPNSTRKEINHDNR